ncbi:hypothetical protein VSH64_34435 [Amycolatopsis rhabdoformis]|uniref:Uncharacterized protein n=1 Tax=Amycolatopsis rhabdoformis TaxID=1448059 RepID=A0ABZ1I292_9PSEU|nr:hypothetical protein [Amycolatopsis rhabdoformis]WSE27917.1 hypothetical protein VSH64_34435 [Amycolatopsis rhabdoformis]
MSARNLSPLAIERLAIRRFAAKHGRTWAKATKRERAAWLARTEPCIREEHGIAPGAEWRGGDWQAPQQADLFDLIDTPEVTA